jgi:hypothetical protein
MATEDEEVVDAEVQPGEEDTIEETSEESFADDSSEENDKLRAAYEDQKKRAEKLEKQLKEAKPQKGTEPSQSNTELSELKTSFELFRDGYTPEESDRIAKYAKGADMTIEEAKKDDFVVAGIDARRKAREAEDKTPGASNQGGVKVSTDFRKIVGSGKASANEKQKAFEERMKNSKR